MKNIIFLIAFLLHANLGMSLSKGTNYKPTLSFVIASDTTKNDGWSDDSWSLEPLPRVTLQDSAQALSKKQIRKAKKAKKINGQGDVLDSTSNFPRGVGWTSVALALIGLAKILAQNCK